MNSNLMFKELLNSRELLYFLVWRDIKVRYRQAVLGAVWVVLQPLITVAVYSLIFSAFVRFPNNDVPYHLYVFIGLWPWLFFSGVVLDAGNSLVGNSHLITKIYFPRIFLPASRLLALLSDFLIMGALLFVFLVYYGYTPSASWLLLPFLVALTLSFTFAVTIIYSAINVKYRDFHFIMPFVVQLWMFCSPIIYSREVLPETYSWLFTINPLVGIIEAFHSVFLGSPVVYSSLVYPLLLTLMLLVIGLRYFVNAEEYFADII